MEDTNKINEIILNKQAEDILYYKNHPQIFLRCYLNIHLNLGQEILLCMMMQSNNYLWWALRWAR